MSITEEQRYHLFQALRGVIGNEDASTLMEHLPPVGWADVATKRDLDHLKTLMDARFDRVDLRFDAVESRLEARLQAEIRKQTLTMITAMTVIMGIFASVSSIF